MPADPVRVRSLAAFAPCALRGTPDRLAELEGLGYDEWTRRRRQHIDTHAHRQWEVMLIVRGAFEYRIAGEHHALRGGDAFVVRPGERHDGSERIRQRTGIAWLCLAEPIERLPGLVARDAAALAAGYAAIRQRRFPASPTTVAAWADLLACARAGEPLRDVLVRTAAHRVLAAVLADHAAHAGRGGERAAPSAAVERATAILRERLGAPISVDALARAVGVSRSVLHERFLADLGVTPMAYWTGLRIARAKRLLAGGATSAAAAAALGFATAQHFARVFKEITGETPRGWAARRGDAGADEPAAG